MGAAEWAFLWTVVGLTGVATLGWSLLATIWGGRRPRRLRLATAAVSALLVVVGASFPVTMAQPTLVAGVSEDEPNCHGARVIDVEPLSPGGRVRGMGGAGGACGVWAVIEDPRTGVLWLQGAATGNSAGWVLDLALGTGNAGDGKLPYHVHLLAVSAETQQAWSDAATTGGTLQLGQQPVTNGWIARGLTFAGGE